MRKERIKTEMFEDYIKKNTLSRTSFCKLCGISYSTYIKILNQDFDFGISALFKIGKVISAEIYEMFEEIK